MAVIDPHDPSAVPDLDREARAERSRRRAIFGLVGAFLLVLVIIVLVQWITDSDGDSAAGDPLPEFTLATLDGDAFELRSVVGEPTVLNFFASWCAPCRAELPEFQEVSLDARERGVNFLGINTRETDAEAASDLLAVTGVTYPVALGDDGRLFEEVGGLAMPTTAFVSADGTIVEVHSGILRGDDLRAKIEEHFG